MGDSINVKWNDGPSSKQVTNIIDNFQDSHFDAMNDLSEYVSNAWHIFGSAKYVHANRNVSQEKLNTIIPSIEKAIEERKNDKSKSSLLPIEGTSFLIGLDNGRFTLWNDTYICSGNNAERFAAYILDQDVMPKDLTKETIKEEQTNINNELTDKPIVRKNEEKNGIEVIFNSKPEENMLTWLKSNGFQRSKFFKLWYNRFSEELFNKTIQAIA
jgi:hypothetical protein